LAESAGEKDAATQPLPLRLPTGADGGQGGGHVIKAQGPKPYGRNPWPSNRESARGGWQTNRQTFRALQ